MRMRITVKKSGARADDLRLAAEIRRDLWEHSPVAVDPDNPLHGTHRDNDGRAYFEFSTSHPEEVRRALQKYEARVDVTEPQETLGEPCLNCGNIAGPVLPAVCPNCYFRDISPCPSCAQEIPRQAYIALGRRLFRCPNCRTRVRMRFNDPRFLPDGNFSQPLVVVEGAEVVKHEV